MIYYNTSYTGYVIVHTRVSVCTHVCSGVSVCTHVCSGVSVCARECSGHFNIAFIFSIYGYPTSSPPPSRPPAPTPPFTSTLLAAPRSAGAPKYTPSPYLLASSPPSPPPSPCPPVPSASSPAQSSAHPPCPLSHFLITHSLACPFSRRLLIPHALLVTTSSPTGMPL